MDEPQRDICKNCGKPIECEQGDLWVHPRSFGRFMLCRPSSDYYAEPTSTPETALIASNFTPATPETEQAP